MNEFVGRFVVLSQYSVGMWGLFGIRYCNELLRMMIYSFVESQILKLVMFCPNVLWASGVCLVFGHEL